MLGPSWQVNRWSRLLDELPQQGGPTESRGNVSSSEVQTGVGVGKVRHVGNAALPGSFTQFLEKNLALEEPGYWAVHEARNGVQRSMAGN